MGREAGYLSAHHLRPGALDGAVLCAVIAAHYALLAQRCVGCNGNRTRLRDPQPPAFETCRECNGEGWQPQAQERSSTLRQGAPVNGLRRSPSKSLAS